MAEDALPLAAVIEAPIEPELRRLFEGVVENARRARSDRTRELYAYEWGRYCDWCTANAQQSLPSSAATVAMYLQHLVERGYKPSSIDLALSTICARHRGGQFPNPRNEELVRLQRAWLRRKAGVAPREVRPLVVEELRATLDWLSEEDLGQLRDRALLLVGFAGALRESEIVALDVGDVEIGKQRMLLTIRRAKTDQLGQGAMIGVTASAEARYCPLHALGLWLKRAGIESGPVFRGVDRWEHVSRDRLTVRQIDRIVQRSMRRAGLDADDYAGHSLRAGLATSAADAGHSLDAIMRQTRHKSVEVARRYIRRADAFRENVLDGLI
jgi:integrase